MIQDAQKPGVFDLAVQLLAQFREINGLVEMPDIEFHEMATVPGSDPLLNILPRVFYAAFWKIAAGVPIHAFDHHVLYGQHRHPLDKMIFQPRNLDLPLFAAGYDLAPFPGFMLPAAFFQLFDQLHSIGMNL